MSDWHNQTLMIVGDPFVGKRAIIDQITGKRFQIDHLATVGADYLVYEKIIDGEKYKFQLWDLASQPKFKSIRSNFYRGAMGGLCIFDLTNRESFTNIISWIDEIWQNSGKGLIPIILLGNKADLIDERTISIDEINNFTKELSKKTRQHGFDVNYLDISAKTRENIDLAFDIIAKQVVKSLK